MEEKDAEQTEQLHDDVDGGGGSGGGGCWLVRGVGGGLVVSVGCVGARA